MPCGTAAERLQCSYMTAANESYQPDSSSGGASPGKKVLHQCKSQQMLARRWQLQNMQNLPFIYLLLNDPKVEAKRAFFSVNLVEKNSGGGVHFSCSSLVTGTSKSGS